MPPRNPPRLTTLILLTGLSVASLNMILPSLGDIAVEFGVDYAVAALAVGAYLVVSAALQLVIGPLSDLYGRRPVLLAGLGIFVVASVGCAVAQDFTTFLAFRMVQAAVMVGGILPRAIVRDMAPPREATRILGQIGTVMALSPLLAPALGGLLDEILGWRSNFVLFVVAGGAMFAIAWRNAGETNADPQPSFWRQFRSYPTLLASVEFWAWALCAAASVGAFYAYVAGMPLVGPRDFGMSSAMVGVMIGLISGGFMLGNMATVRASGRVDTVTMVRAGRWITVAGTLVGGLMLSLGTPHWAMLLVGAMSVGLGNGLTMPGASTGVMSVNPRLAGSASGLSGALVVAFGAVLTPLTGHLVAAGNGPARLAFLMFACAVAGLVVSYAVRRLPEM